MVLGTGTVLEFIKLAFDQNFFVSNFLILVGNDAILIAEKIFYHCYFTNLRKPFRDLQLHIINR